MHENIISSGILGRYARHWVVAVPQVAWAMTSGAVLHLGGASKEDKSGLTAICGSTGSDLRHWALSTYLPTLINRGTRAAEPASSVRNAPLKTNPGMCVHGQELRVGREGVASVLVRRLLDVTRCSDWHLMLRGTLPSKRYLHEISPGHCSGV